MKPLALWLAGTACAFAAATDDFIATARDQHGAFGEKAARFLVEHMPAKDHDTLAADFLVENLDLALKARATFPWAKDLPEEIFLNDVLPYAVFDEPRDAWRADFVEAAAPIVKDARSAGEAAQLLNQSFFNRIQVHYDTGRKRTNQSPKESIEQGKATCTGLAILLVDACRAVGIPARAAGTPMWSNGRGNHTWVEIWDKGWHFTGADEYDAQGLDRGWFTGDAAKARADQPEHAIYATSWKKEGLSFPMVWSPGDDSVAAVNVTARYVKPAKGGDRLGVRLFSNRDRGSRVAVAGMLVDDQGSDAGRFTTKAGTTDLNDMPRLRVKPGASYRLRFVIDGGLWQTATFEAGAGETTRDVYRDELEPCALTREQAAAVVRATCQQLVEKDEAARTKELEDKAISLGDKTLRWLEKTFGKEPKDGRSLWISMHGGGNAPPELNDQQWQNQIGLYQPKEGIYVAPRAPTNTWNLWHEAHIDPMFSRLIEDMVALRGVNPDKVYLMGYSAGGDGVWQLAPRMADRFAAASMMAGHPNEARLEGLRNLPFAIFMGGEDGAYDRNKIAAQRAKQLDELQAADPDGYVHESHLYKGLGHWMNGKDAEAVRWMPKFTRNPWPKKIVWVQDDVTHDRFYWLQLPPGAEKHAGQRIVATVEGQTVKLEGEVPDGIRLLLGDALLDLDRPVNVQVNDRSPKEFKVTRNAGVIREALEQRLDPRATPTASLVVE